MAHPDFDEDIKPLGGTIFSINPKPIYNPASSAAIAKAFSVKLSLRKKKSSVSPSK